MYKRQVAGSVAALQPAAAHGPGKHHKKATIQVTIVAPDGVPGTVTLRGKKESYVAAKPTTGTSTTVKLSVPAGKYRLRSTPVTVDGVFHSWHASRFQIEAKAGKTTKVIVWFTPETTVRDLHVLSVEKTKIQLTWTAEPKVKVVVRRANGSKTPKSRHDGISVPISGDQATDSGLTAGSEYTYALFAKKHNRWIGPMTIKVGTVSDDPTKAAYVANAQTVLLTAADIESAEPTGSGVEVVLASNAPRPVVGAAVVLPVSASLQGGFLGVVTALSTDGQTLTLRAGSLDEAFDYYELNIDAFSDTDAQPQSKSSRGTPHKSEPVSPSQRKPLTKTGGEPAHKTAAVPALLKDCSGGGAAEISISPSFSSAGHFSSKLDKWNVPGPDVPKGASFDMGLSFTVTGAASVKTSGNVTCNLAPEPPKPIQLSASPVPIMLAYSPTIQFSIEGAVEVSNIGLTATAGFEVAGHFGLTSGSSFSGKPIFNATPLTPSVTKSGSIGFKAGGQVTVGPGAGTTNAGVIAGISGEINPIDAKFSAVFPQDDPRFNACLKIEAAYTRSVSLTAKAWLGKWDVSQSVTLDFLQGRTDYFEPKFYPEGCKDVVAPGDSVLGGGVTKINDSVAGGDNQWGYVPGFVPGKKTWVLSTGDIANAVGEPSTFASTALGGSGDPDLDVLSGHPTYDAVAYNVKLVPTGTKLHVRYAFASEEYPEYVGSSFNDVMAVYVNGSNCGFAPGSTTPVSVNTINAGENGQYFVDNQTGASGYGTTMDGLTVPLECTVPVTPGIPVDVKITVADASDRIFDSAVALLDQGIWSD